MRTKIIVRVAAGSAVALFLTAVPVLATGAHAATPSSTTLTGAEARAALLAIGRASDAKAFRVGVRAYSSYQDAIKDERWSRFATTTTLDVARDTMRQTSKDEGDIPVAAIAYGACPEFGDWTVARDGVGKWRATDRSDRSSLKLLGKPGARWVKVPGKPSLRKQWAQDNVASSFGIDGALRGARFGTATKTVAAVGTVYVMPYALDGATGEVRLIVGSDGTLTKFRQITDLKRARGSELIAKTYTYGKQTVRLPSAKKAVKASALRRGCLAAETRSAVPYLAKFGRGALNGEAAETGKRVTAAKIRDQFDYLEEAIDPALGVDVHRIKYGVQIVGRHELLKHPAVWTVFVRDGKAVAHRVR